MKIKLGVLALVAIVSAMPAAGQSGLGGFKRDFDTIDRDSDGQLSWVEFESRVTEMFYFSDLDTDGELTRQEAPVGVSRRWQEFDGNSDDRITLGEFVENHRRSFTSADSSGDSALSEAEVDALPRPRKGRGG